MAKADSSLFDLSHLETLARQDTFLHHLDPRVKVLTTLAFIVTVMSFHKYEVTGLIPFFAYPVAMIALGGLPGLFLLRKVLLAAPFVVLVGIFNPLLDRSPLVHLGPVELSGGWVSFFSILIRFLLTVLAALILVASTGFYSVCVALERLAVPRALVTQLLFLFRYLFVLIDEARRLVRARSLRSFGHRAIGWKVFGSMVGHLLLRTLDRAQRIHTAMLCRGFDGEIRIPRPLRLTPADAVFLGSCSLAFLCLRLYDLPQWLGTASVGLFR